MIVVKSDKIKIVNPVNTIDWGGGVGGLGVVVVLLSPVSKQSNNLSSPKIKKNTDSI